mmetsp:Transcript_5874/g.11451  ORF Transcript_5874/g.11451 Transcript_5874/m.11451 type:complete len:367 (+) Transcript_5874:177-1277(+)
MDKKKEIPVFPGATHASVVRAHEKDQGYLGEFNSRCYDLVRRILGSHTALLWRREIKLMSDMMYYHQTIGCGTSTLGEEYCSIMRVDSRTNHSIGKLRNTMLAMLQALSPYVDDAAEAWRERQRGGMPDLSVDAQLLRVSRSMNRSSQERTSRYIAKMERLYTRACEKATQMVSGLPGRDTGASILLWIVEHKSTLLRIHLALFYLFRVYYHIPKRILGIRYRGYGRHGNASEPVTLYTILGILLLSQASSTALLWAIGMVHRNDKRDGRIAEQQTSDGVALYDYQGNLVVRDLMADHMEMDHPSTSHGHKCPLCLSQRQVPTATPCGHVFCWTCIGEWCSKKPECPLCRSMALPSQLVVVRHADF